jgi:WD40 repeat protein
MHSAMAAWEQANVGRTLELLQRHRPREGETDHRAFEWFYLWDQCRRGLASPSLDVGAEVYSLAVSPDGQLFATGDDKGRLLLWDVDQRRILRTMQMDERINHVAFSPDGQIIAGSAFDTARLWNVATGELLQELKGHTFFILSLSFSPDGTRLATGSKDRTVRIWSLTAGDAPLVIRAFADIVCTVGWQDDRTLITACKDGSVQLWDGQTGQEHATATSSKRLQKDSRRSMFRILGDPVRGRGDDAGRLAAAGSAGNLIGFKP